MGQEVPVSQTYPKPTSTVQEIRAYHGPVQEVIRFELPDAAVDPSVTDLGLQVDPGGLVQDASRIQELLMRALDVTGSSILLILASPVMLLAAFLIKATSVGPVFYKQDRVGKGGRLFTLYKFRSMINDAEKHLGPVWAARDDDRVTSVGKVLRRARLDELPQLLNILWGDMSLVGPRPERPFFVRRHKALQGIRLTVRPGLTGLAQVRAFYDLKPEHKLRYDYLYIQKRSFLLNLSILMKTIPVVIRKTGW